MELAKPTPLGWDYASVAAVAETIASQTGMRTLADFAPLLMGMGAKIERSEAAAWASPHALSLRVEGPRDFTVWLPKEPSGFDRLFLATALGHYLLHAQEGRAPTEFGRFDKGQWSLEGLWFGMALVIPDAVFAQAQASGMDDHDVASMLRLPTELLGLKRRLAASAQRP